MSDSTGFNTQSMAIKAQKKILGKMASRNVAKHFIDDVTARILDNFYKILKDYYSKPDAEKVIKNIVKLTLKVMILERNGQLRDHSDIRQLHAFQQKFRMLLMTVVSFTTVEFSYDRSFVISLLNQSRELLSRIVARHLSPKSMERLDSIVSRTTDGDFLDALFSINSPYKETVAQISGDINQLIETDPNGRAEL